MGSSKAVNSNMAVAVFIGLIIPINRLCGKKDLRKDFGAQPGNRDGRLGELVGEAVWGYAWRGELGRKRQPLNMRQKAKWFQYTGLGTLVFQLDCGNGVVLLLLVENQAVAELGRSRDGLFVKRSE